MLWFDTLQPLWDNNICCSNNLGAAFGGRMDFKKSLAFLLNPTNPALRDYISSRVTLSFLFHCDSLLYAFISSFIGLGVGVEFSLHKNFISIFWTKSSLLRSILTKLISCTWAPFQVKMEVLGTLLKASPPPLPTLTLTFSLTALRGNVHGVCNGFCNVAWGVGGYYWCVESRSIRAWQTECELELSTQL